MKVSPKELSPYSLSVRIRVLRGNTVLFGSGVLELLQLTNEYHSLHKAAMEINMSYKKALRIVNRAEEEFGRKILEKTIGGAGGGGSRLTEFGSHVVKQFTLLEEEASDQIEILMNKYFPEEMMFKK